MQSYRIIDALHRNDVQLSLVPYITDPFLDDLIVIFFRVDQIECLPPFVLQPHLHAERLRDVRPNFFLADQIGTDDDQEFFAGDFLFEFPYFVFDEQQSVTLRTECVRFVQVPNSDQRKNLLEFTSGGFVVFDDHSRCVEVDGRDVVVPENWIRFHLGRGSKVSGMQNGATAWQFENEHHSTWTAEREQIFVSNYNELREILRLENSS